MELKVSVTQWKEIKKLYEGGKSLVELAQLYNISPSWVSVNLKKMGTKIRDYYFKRGCNVWANLTEEQTRKRKEEFRKRMQMYNPMKREEIAAKVAEKLRLKTGEKNANFRHGQRIRIVRRLTFRQKNKILQKRGNKCELCNIPEPLTVHHKDGDRGNNNPENLIVLCFNCAGMVHYGKNLTTEQLELRKQLLPKETIRQRYSKEVIQDAV